jgi:SpoVK/Ycf46/Vps4 family AAA+-type ATPase
MAKAITEAHYAKTVENQFLEITYRSGKKDFLYRGDLASGAIIAAIVERAKSLAIKRSIETKQETQLTREDLARLAKGIRGERSLPADGHHGRLAQADGFRSRKRDQAGAHPAAQERFARNGHCFCITVKTRLKTSLHRPGGQNKEG